MSTDQYLRNAMIVALKLAKEKGTPFGAVLLDLDYKIVAMAANSTGIDGPLAHAEINLLRNGWEKIGDLSSYTLVSTCEPCPMCMGAIVWYGIEKVYFGAYIEDAAQYLSQIHVPAEEIANKSKLKIEIHGGLLREECISLFELMN